MAERQTHSSAARDASDPSIPTTIERTSELTCPPYVRRRNSESVESPILGTVTDYSLFTPRGHYTRTKQLRRYFVALSVLGQTAVLKLNGGLGTGMAASDHDDVEFIWMKHLGLRHEAAGAKRGL